MPAADFDELEARLRAVRGLIGVDPTHVPPDVPPHVPPDVPPHVPPDVPPHAPAVSGPSHRPETTLRVPRIGWDLVLLAGAWAGLLSVIIALLV